MPDREEDLREAWRSMARLFMSDEIQQRVHLASDAADLPHPGALKALMRLDADDPPAMRALAEAMHCDASYVTGLVDTLEEQGYVERRVSRSDRRMKLVQLTDAGRHAKTVALDALLVPPKGFDRLGDDEIRSLRRLLAQAADDYPAL